MAGGVQEADVFWMLVGNGKDLLRTGALVEARARGVTAACVFCTLPDLQVSPTPKP